MATTINASTSAGLVNTADTSGVLSLQTNGTTAVTVDASQRTAFVAGTASLPAITTTGNTNTGIFFPAADTIAFSKGGAEAMRIDSSGNVGIGTNSPAGRLHARFDAGVGDGFTGKYIFQTTDQRLTIGTYWEAGIGQYARIQSSTNAGIAQNLLLNPDGGNVGIGTSSPNNEKLEVNGGIRSLAGTTVSRFLSFSNTCFFGTLSNDPLVIQTGNTERMRIDTSGNLLVGTTSTVQSGVLSVLSATTTVGFRTTAAAGGGLVLDISRTAATGDMVYFRTSSTTLAGYITCPTGTTTSYLSVSDYRLKENVTPMTGALEKISELKPCTYTWKADGTAGQGFIAHELQAVVPDCVGGIKDAVNEDGSIKPQGVDTSFLVATLTAAIQELKAINDAQAETITALTARITALETP